MLDLISKLFGKANENPASDTQELERAKGILNALDKSMARIEFSSDGTIIAANANFLNAMGIPKMKLLANTTVFSVSPPTRTALTTQNFGGSLRAENTTPDA